MTKDFNVKSKTLKLIEESIKDYVGTWVERGTPYINLKSTNQKGKGGLIC